MALLFVGDREKTVKFRFRTHGTPDGLSATSAKLMVRLPGSGGSVEWPVAIVPGETSSNVVVLAHTLASNGSDLPVAGKYQVRSWLYQDSTLIADSSVGQFQVDQKVVDWPD